MNRTGRKYRTFEQKQKRPNSHQVGKQFQISYGNKSYKLNLLLRTQMLLKTNKDYKVAEFQHFVGGLFVFLPTIYIFIGYFYYGIVRAGNSYAYQFISRMASLDFSKSSATEQFQEPTFWEIFKNYSWDYPIIVGGVVIISLLVGIFLSKQGNKKQRMIESNTNDESLKKDYEKLIEKGSFAHD